MLLIGERTLVTVQIFYIIPGFQTILNEFVWQTLDRRPRYPRVHRFLDYWEREIEAVIKEITICDARYAPPVRHITWPPQIL